ncbi:choice-of-anchor G family protein [Cellulomonas sp. NPDC089187]|uniref:choice-of-anchor G family protein n=1 Tax=Cellulomonas sp. NPDC089187 TaxID=3154970 RepID=UPI0034163517
MTRPEPTRARPRHARLDPTRRRRRITALSLLTVLVAGLALHTGPLRAQLTDAAWTDREYVSSTLGTRATWCDTGLYRTTARGQLFAGTVGAGSTGSVSAVTPLRVTQTGTSVSATPASATSSGANTYVAPVAASALQSTTSTLESSVSFGSVTAAQNNQYGSAASTGLVVGGSGAVSNAGVLNAATQAAGSGLPDLATVDVRALVTPTLLTTALGSAAATDVTGGLRLIPGTVASTTTRDACISRNTTARAYGVSGLRLEAESTSLRAASTQTTAAATAIQNSLTSTGAVASTTATNVNTVFRTRQELLNLLTPGASTGSMSLSVAVNVPAAVAALTTQTLTSGAVQLNLATGRMTVDLAALTNATTGVNGLPPNTEALTAAVMSAASTAVGSLLPAYQTSVLNAISTALNTSVATITVNTTISLLGLLLSEPTVITYTGTLNQLRAQAAGTVGVSVGVNNSCGILTASACTSVRNSLNSAGGQADLKAAVANALTSTIYGTSTTAPVPPQGQIVAAVNTAQTTLQTLLANLPNAVSAQVNVQADVTSPAPRPVVTLDAGELGVTALRIGSVPAGRTAWLAFGTSAAGPNAYLLAP